jgi:hypothetical protein
VIQDPKNLILIPTLGKAIFAHWYFFFLRLRKAARDFPVSSYAVIMNALSGSGSKTYMILK